MADEMVILCRNARLRNKTCFFIGPTYFSISIHYVFTLLHLESTRSVDGFFLISIIQRNVMIGVFMLLQIVVNSSNMECCFTKSNNANSHNIDLIFLNTDT